MTAQVTQTLDQPGMLARYLASFHNGSGEDVGWIDEEANRKDLEELFVIDIEGTHAKPPCMVSIVYWEKGIRKDETWLLNPLTQGKSATIHACSSRFGNELIFGRVFEAMVGPLSPEVDGSCPVAMKTLHEAVIKLPTIKESRCKILAAIQLFKCGIHFHVADAHILNKTLGSGMPMLDLGKVINRFLRPVRANMKASGQVCTSQSVTCLVMKGEWKSPHLPVNDAHMHCSSFQVLVNLVDINSRPLPEEEKLAKKV